MKEHIIESVIEGSIGWELQIEPGDKLLAINDKEIKDIFDYHYLVNDEYLEVLIEKQNGEEWLLEVEKEEDEDLGLSFSDSLMDKYKSCHNKCIFCFIDQNPKGMRETIYFKDDDTRLSFLQGNYVTLTNLQLEDIERIIEYKLAPINISVHTTNGELRKQMLNNRFADRLLSYMDMLYEADIPMNAQIVLCKGYNDGIELDNTIKCLLKYAPVLQSVSVVPVGLTKYRENLCELESFDKEDCRQVIATVEKYQKLAMKQHDINFIHASDEWYISSGINLPDEDNYDGYIQLENGVGMTRLFREEVKAAVDEYLINRGGKVNEAPINVSSITGLLVHEQILEAVEDIKRAFPNLNMTVYPIRNDFFGPKITVTGLLTGWDIVAQLRGKELNGKLIIPANVLRADEDVFLDNMTLEEFQNALQVEVIIVQSSGMDLFKQIAEMEI